MSVATIADRTGYSKSSWERYLGGRLLPPRGATHALGDVTGTDIRHLETMWELAERAWSRDEMRHDVTMEAIRVAQAREALGEFWDDEPAKGRKWGRNKDKAREKDKNRDKNRGKERNGGRDEGSAAPGTAPKEEEWKEKTGENSVVPAESSHQRSWDFFAPPSASAIPGAREGSTAAPDAPGVNRPPMDDETAVLRPRPLPGRGGRRQGHGESHGGGSHAGRGAGTAGVPSQRVDVASWGTPGERPGSGAPGGDSGKAGPWRAEPPGADQGPPAYPGRGAYGAPDDGDGADLPGGPEGPGGGTRSSRGRRVAALLGGAVGVFAVLGAGVLVFGLPGESGEPSASPSPSATNSPRTLPAGVKCQGESCTGKDPEKMGCGGQNVKSSNSAFVGPSMVEVRYSKVCKAAWGRITGAAQGDNLKISAGGEAASDKVGTTNDAYTEMVAVTSATEARACATLVAGTTGCTKVDASGASGADETAGTASSADPAGTADSATTGDVGASEGTGDAEGPAGTGDAVR
ncbi:DUF2690 domain-containing protein [Streptomyces sp. WMMB 322]|uniref:DUF2690 domain-containing protein n=1 Tax=Streptomyces sp. WMMB 322 TaxID=1286821 RepID=UPI0020C8274E|nr:DUF2690 domain-containing protein [Streptomyces sp. WMMB 322]